MQTCNNTVPCEELQVVNLQQHGMQQRRSAKLRQQGNTNLQQHHIELVRTLELVINFNYAFRINSDSFG